MTYDEVKENFPAEFKARGCDKLNYRYPKGNFKNILELLKIRRKENGNVTEKFQNMEIVPHMSIYIVELAQFSYILFKILSYILS